MRLRPAGWTISGTSVPSSRRALQIVTWRPCSSARAPMCGESARMRRQASSGSVEVELAVRGRDLLGVRRLALLRLELRRLDHVVRAAAPRPRRRGRSTCARVVVADREPLLRGDRAGVELRDRLVDRHAGLLVAGEDRALDRRRAAPAREERRMDVQEQRLLEQARRDVEAVRADDDAVDVVGQLGLLGLVHRDAEPLGRLLRGRRARPCGRGPAARRAA